MTVLRLLSLVVIAGICIGIFAGICLEFQGLSAAKRARSVALKLSSEINDVINTGDSSPPLEIKIPSEYTLYFENNETGWQLKMDGTHLPEGGFDLPVEFENRSKLGVGVHKLRIELENNWVIVSKVD